MDTPFLSWGFVLFLLWWAIMDDILAVAAHDHGCGVGGCVADCAFRYTRRPFIIVNIWLLLLQLSVGEPVIGAAAANICLRGYLLLRSHACILPWLCIEHKKGSAS